LGVHSQRKKSNFLTCLNKATISTAHNLLHVYVDSSHAAIQILHQAYVCSFEYILLLVGDATGDINQGA
jgi:hypothetical protein